MRHQSGSAGSVPIVCASAARVVTSRAENSSASTSIAVAMAVAACRNLAVRPSRTSEAGISGGAGFPEPMTTQPHPAPPSSAERGFS